MRSVNTFNWYCPSVSATGGAHVTEQTDSLCGEGPALHQFPFTSRGHPLGMSRLIRPVLLAALLITSIHLHRTVQRVLNVSTLRNVRRCEECVGFLTFRRCTRSRPGRSRRETWTAAWRRSPCGCCPTPPACWQCSPAGGDWRVGSRPAGCHRHTHKASLSAAVDVL